jgi:hypothetical protein
MRKLTIKIFKLNEKDAKINIEKNKNFILNLKKRQSFTRGWNFNVHVQARFPLNSLCCIDSTFTKAFQVLTD